jgi:hypothetical protein
MNSAFECIVCSACGCGVSLYNSKGITVSKGAFAQNPIPLYCNAHIPQITVLSAVLKDDQVLTAQQKINYLNNS